MSLTIKPATRQNVKPLICLYAESGCGKTYSSLLLARGFVGPTGKICMVDSERGRGSLYADVISGGYDVLQLEDPFSPSRYIEAINAVESGGYSIGVMDSGSHEWEGIGGVLQMAGDNEARSGKAGLHNWKAPKLEHSKFVLRLMQSTIPWIVCLRAKHKTRQVKSEGRTVIVKDDYTTPIQADDFIFEMTAHGEILQDHSFRLTKCSHPKLRECFPTQGPIKPEHGEAIARWCSNPSAHAVVAPVSDMKVAKAALWAKLKSLHVITGQEKDWQGVEVYLVSKDLLDDSKTIRDLSAEEINNITSKL